MKFFSRLMMLTFFLFSCEDKKSEKDKLLEFKPNKNVVSFKIVEILNDKFTGENINSLLKSELNPKYDTVKYMENEIHVSYLEVLTGCVKYDGDIQMKNDSLILKLVPINNEACTELLIGRIEFVIKNPNNKTYKIAKNH